MIYVVVVSVALAAAEAAWLLWPARHTQLLRSRVRRRVLVTLHTGEAFDGVLFGSDRQALVLRNASQVGVVNRGTPVPVDGEVVVLLEDVAYLQLP